MLNFLDQGKGLYIEGCDFGYDNGTTELYQRFGCTFVGNGNVGTTGNIVTVIGQTGSITEGKDYSYLYQQGPDSYVDNINADGGTMLFECQSSLGRAVCYAGPTNTYRAIHSTFIFGALRDGASTKNELMALYLDYLLGGP